MDKCLMHRPFLKWAGGKYQIIDRLRSVLPPGRRLVEPFVGSGAVFLNTDYRSYLLADSNSVLIDLFLLLQREGEPFIEYCWTFFTEENNTKFRYYELRDEFNATDDARRKAALLLFMNRHGFNSLIRFNQKGHLNTPFGRYQKPYFPEREMRYFLTQAGKALFMVADFRETMRTARPGDVVYCDPPYQALSQTANFTSYCAGGFSMQDQADLANLAQELAGRGVPVLVSNHATEWTLTAYRAARIEQFGVQRFISCKGNNRGKAQEVLALFTGEESPAS